MEINRKGKSGKSDFLIVLPIELPIVLPIALPIAYCIAWYRLVLSDQAK